MLHPLINHSPDLKRLRDDGYEISNISNYLTISNVPYFNSMFEIKFGTLVSELTLAGDKTSKPKTHVVLFKGEHPCNKDGTPIKQITHAQKNQLLANNLEVNYSFSNKPKNGYSDYYNKMVRYIEIISAPVRSINPEYSAKTFKVIETVQESSVFRYFDTNSSRAGINIISEKLARLKISIIGLGGTGSYILDFVSKTPVKEIHLYDGDLFLSHNAFRSPGAASINQLKKHRKKTEYLKIVYSKMHKKIIAHSFFINDSNIDKLSNFDFVFICIDDGELKELLFNSLIKHNIPFIDVGIGVNPVDDMLIGDIRTTIVTPDKNSHVKKRVSFNNTEYDAYSTNIQIAELNALNASFAVIKWKKYFGFYQDLEKEYNSTFSLNVNTVFNDDNKS